MTGSEDRQRHHRWIAVIHDVDADPAVRIEACNSLLRAVYEERRDIEQVTRQSLLAMLRRDMRETRTELKKAMVRRRPVGVA